MLPLLLQQYRLTKYSKRTLDFSISWLNTNRSFKPVGCPTLHEVPNVYHCCTGYRCRWYKLVVTVSYLKKTICNKFESEIAFLCINVIYNLFIYLFVVMWSSVFLRICLLALECLLIIVIMISVSQLHVTPQLTQHCFMPYIIYINLDMSGLY